MIIQRMEQKSVWTRTVVSIPMLYFSTSIWIWMDVNTSWENWSKFHQNSDEILWTCQAYSRISFSTSVPVFMNQCSYEDTTQQCSLCFIKAFWDVWPAIFHDAVLHQSDKTVLPLQPKHSLICSLNLSVFDVSWAGFNTIKVCKQTVQPPHLHRLGVKIS